MNIELTKDQAIITLASIRAAMPSINTPVQSKAAAQVIIILSEALESEDKKEIKNDTP